MVHYIAELVEIVSSEFDNDESCRQKIERHPAVSTLVGAWTGCGRIARHECLSSRGSGDRSQAKGLARLALKQVNRFPLRGGSARGCKWPQEQWRRRNNLAVDPAEPKSRQLCRAFERREIFQSRR